MVGGMDASSPIGSSDTDMFLEPDIVASLTSENARMSRCIRLAEAAAQSRTPILISGEGGVGKSLMAKFIHAVSSNRSRPLIILRCSELRELEIKNLLFGGNGPASDASGGVRGAAGGGTLVLDRLDVMPASIQEEMLKLLREHPPVRRDDAEAASPRLGMRLVSTTDSSEPILEELLYTLGEILIRIPPLRERREDILPFSIRALRNANRTHGKAVRGLARSAREFLLHYDFPGNVRELFHIVDRAVRLTGRDTIYVEDLGPARDGQSKGPDSPLSEKTLLPLAEMEKRHINKALLRTGWKKSAAARILGVSETFLARKIKLYGLERDGV